MILFILFPIRDVISGKISEFRHFFVSQKANFKFSSNSEYLFVYSKDRDQLNKIITSIFVAFESFFIAEFEFLLCYVLF